MENKKRGITRIINAREVLIEGKKMSLRPIGFDMDEGYLRGGPTVVEITHQEPKFFSSADSGAGLLYMNYFVGEISVNWQPKISQKKGKSYYSEQQRIVYQKENGFFVFLPEKMRDKDLFDKLVANKEKIREWINLWYNYEGSSYCHNMHIGNVNVVDINIKKEQLVKIHEELISKGLTEHDGTIINPQYMFVITNKKVKQACYNHSSTNGRRLDHSYKTFKRLNIQWITPNVCLANNEEDFFELMKECYGITEISK